MNKEELLKEFQNKSLEAYCELSEKEGFLFKKNDGFKSEDETNGYCVGFQNGYKQALIDMNK